MKKILLLAVFAMSALEPLRAQTTFPALLAQGPAPQHREKLMLFGQFVGDWDFQGIEYHADGTKPTDKGEISFRWVLGGRAVQDVWIEYGRSDAQTKTHGTTVRFYDPAIDAWQVTWSDPPTGSVQGMVGRRVGDEIVMEGKRPNGTAIRWIFSQIQPNSFHWRGEELMGKSWRVTEELSAQRRANAVPR